MSKMIKIRELRIDIPEEAQIICEQMLSDLEKSKRPILEAVKASLDNSFYNPKVGYLTAGVKTVKPELVVTETMYDGSKATIDLSTLGTSPFQPKNKPQALRLKAKKKIDFCLIVESEGTANTLQAMGFTRRNKCILMGAQGVPSNAVRGWCKLISEELDVPMYFFGDLDAYTMQNIFRTLKAGSAASLIRNADFSAPEVKFLGVLPD